MFFGHNNAVDFRIDQYVGYLAAVNNPLVQGSQ
jgi:hypothetical protein